jgi:cell shape-determining protein MreC
MRLRQARKPVRRTYLTVLLVASIALFIVPAALTGRLISLIQVLIPFQHGAAIAADSVGGTVDGAGAPVPRAQYDDLQRAKAALQHQVAALATRVTELEREVDILTTTRLWDAAGGAIGSLGLLVPADIVAGDFLTWRSSRLVNVGTLRGVERGAPVTSNMFTVGEGTGSGVGTGMAVLFGEVLVGYVEQAGTHAARVRLLSDLGVEQKVRIGRFSEDGFGALDSYFWLVGRGDGMMEIRDAKRRDVDAGLIAVGDIVLSDPTSSVLPSALTIGKVTAIAPDHDNPLHSLLTIEGAVDVAALRRVYVYVPEPEVPAQTESGPR